MVEEEKPADDGLLSTDMESGPNARGAWALNPTTEMRDVRILAETFEKPRPDYIRANVPMRPKYAQL